MKNKLSNVMNVSDRNKDHGGDNLRFKGSVGFASTRIMGIFCLGLLCLLGAPCVLYAATSNTAPSQAGNPGDKQMIIRELPDQLPGPQSGNLLDEYRVLQGIWKGEVVSTSNAHPSVIPGTKKEITLQDVTVRILEGEKKGKEVLVENDFRELKKGDAVLVNYFVNRTIELYSINERDRRGVLLFGGIIFLAVLVYLGRRQMLRSLAGLGGALLVIGGILIPALLYGFPPLLTIIIAAIAILSCIMYFTYGWNINSTIALIGSIGAVFIAGFFSWGIVKLSGVTGLGSDEALFVNFNTPLNMDFMGLILGGIILGSLGALVQVAIAQVITIQKLYETESKMKQKEIFKAGIADGRGQIGTFFNTLTLAYVGASIPLLMLFSMNTYGFDIIINQEIFAVEITRIIVGGIGLLTVVPLVTIVAMYFFKNKKTRPTT